MTLKSYIPVDMTANEKVVIADIVSSNVPEAFPLDGENIRRLTKQHVLYPGSTIYVVNGAKLYMMDEEKNWVEQ